MRIPKRLLLLLALPVVCALAEGPPKVPTDAVVKPTFMSGYDSFSGGTAFVCEVPGHDGLLLLTAHHLFGSACGLDHEYTWEEMPTAWPAVTGLSIDDPARYVTSAAPLAIPGAHALDDKSYDKDLAAYRVPAENKLPSLRLATAQPKVHETVFLYARQRGEAKLRFFRATVFPSGNSEFMYLFDDSDINLAGTSGAPVLNASGEVVAINIGGTKAADRLFGFGNSCLSIAKLLARAKPPQGDKTPGPDSASKVEEHP